jgi:hypothetical protein
MKKGIFLGALSGYPLLLLTPCFAKAKTFEFPSPLRGNRCYGKFALVKID